MLEENRVNIEEVNSEEFWKPSLRLLNEKLESDVLQFTQVLLLYVQHIIKSMQGVNFNII